MLKRLRNSLRTMSTTIQFSNPRKEAKFTDWPLGGNKRGLCLFGIEHNIRRGWRIVRTTESNKPKLCTFGGRAAIVDGDNGRTYILQHSGHNDSFITIWRSDLLHEGTCFPGDARYAELAAFIAQASPCL